MSDGWTPRPHGDGDGALRGRVARGLTWTVVDTWGRQVLNLAVFVVLARFLAPDDFGVVALAAVFVALAQVVVDQGLGDALIQRRDITRSHVDTAFWVAVLTGLLLTVTTVAVARPVSGFLGEPALQPVLAILSLSFVFAALSSIQIALLRRELAFRSLAVRSLLASLGGGAVGIVLAVLGAGAWALVAQQLVAGAVSVVALWTLSPWRPSLGFSAAHFRELFGFGLNIVGSDLLTFLSRNGDNFLIGAVLGTTPLGFYAVGYRLLDVTQVLLINVARKISFPAFSRMQHDPERMVRAYLKVTRTTSALILPGYVGIALVAFDLVPVLFGSRWQASGEVAAVLFLIGPVLSLQAFSGSYLNAVGRPDVTLRFRLITTATNVVGFLIAVPFGIVAVAAAFVIRGYLLLPLNLHWVRVHGGVPIGAYFAELKGTGLATLLLAAAVVATRLLAGAALAPVALLALQVAVGAATFAATVWIADRRTVHELGELVGHALRRRRDATPGEPIDPDLDEAPTG